MSKNLLLTGGAGFIGHHFVEHVLKKTDWNIIIVDRLTYAGSQNHLVDIECWEKEKGRVNFIFHDFRAPFLGSTLNFITRFSTIDYIVHMGAETHVDQSIAEPRIFVETNVIGTLNMLELAQKICPEKFIYISTDEVYGPVKLDSESRILELHKEGEPHKPSNPYSASKSGAEQLCYSFWNTYGLPIIITNTMNNFGERQNPEKFVPKTVKSILEGKQVTVHCKKDFSGNILDISSRCWLHARNHADGVLFLLQSKKDIFGERFNIVGDWAYVTMLAEMIGTILKKSVDFDYVDFHSFRPGHDMHYGLNGDKMLEMGWKPPLSLTDSLISTISWMQKHPIWL